VFAEFLNTAKATDPKSAEVRALPSHPVMEFNLKLVDAPVIDSESLLLGTVVG
jgi:hypothetical protein